MNNDNAFNPVTNTPAPVVDIEEVTSNAVSAALEQIDLATNGATKQSAGPCGDQLAGRLHQIIESALTDALSAPGNDAELLEVAAEFRPVTTHAMAKAFAEKCNADVNANKAFAKEVALKTAVSFDFAGQTIEITELPSGAFNLLHEEGDEQTTFLRIEWNDAWQIACQIIDSRYTEGDDIQLEAQREGRRVQILDSDNGATVFTCNYDGEKIEGARTDYFQTWHQTIEAIGKWLNDGVR